jgi:ribosomal-protein-alanine N-acetyltransferase
MTMLRGLLDFLFGSPTPVIAEASATEAEKIARLHAAAFHRGWSRDEFERLLSDRSILTHRVLVRGKFAGFVMSRMAADEAEILSVAIAAPQRGRGLARILLRLHLGRLASLGVKTVFLEVEESNAPARRLYRALRFREVGRREGYYTENPSGPANALTLRRDLA